MKIIAHFYNALLLQPTPDRDLWGWESDHVYHDLAIATAFCILNGQHLVRRATSFKSWHVC
ncbi:MAG: hypothetical protein KME27_19355 [Lyngbya sp. HA4199-MV5]|nr:hypothetical protein [Lyngbya sp. HA4199-MV5]